MSDKKIQVDYLTRVEGEGALYVKVKGEKVEEVQFKIFEPPRYFEAFLRGRSFQEAPDITARICGICPVAYQMSSVHAMERALGVTVGGYLRDLRRLLYCGEWIESHVLHVYMLHAPDFLGYQDAIRMAKDHPKAVERGLKMKKIGNDIVTLLGGREIHPINVRVGGFYKIPPKKSFRALLDRIEWGIEASKETIDFVSTLPFPEFEQKYEYVSLSHPTEYPYNEGRLVSSQGLDIDVADYEDHFIEEHVERSNALHSYLKDRGPYLCGPMARYNLNYEKLPDSVKEAARRVGIEAPCHNPFKSIVVRSLETLFAFEEAKRIIEAYETLKSPAVPIKVKAGTGQGCTEAPRGILYHRYEIDDEGAIQNAKIVAPTSQNQKMIEEDLRDFVKQNVSLSKEKLTLKCEQLIRNYDPCISCATHFLKVELEREE